ncbi:MAG: C40 family peptidase [Novosphingobium sp.]|nr:C40 family peptidase [Novosphingobium sp.]
MTISPATPHRHDIGEALANAALGFAGCRFRLHGRDPQTGLDCIGLLSATLLSVGRQCALPNGYVLRNRSLPNLAGIAAANGFDEAAGIPRAGDILLVRVAACQHHLMIALGNGRFIHAHAGLKRVLIHEGCLEWQVIGHWRLTDTI